MPCRTKGTKEVVSDETPPFIVLDRLRRSGAISVRNKTWQDLHPFGPICVSSNPRTQDSRQQESCDVRDFTCNR